MSETLSMIGKLLGHGSIQSTAHYAHLDDADVVRDTQRIGDPIGKMMDDRGALEPVQPAPAHL